VCTPSLTRFSISHSSIFSDYNTFLEAVRAAQADDDGRALELLDKSEEAIDDVVSILNPLAPVVF
jgi:hypothetical protein